MADVEEGCRDSKRRHFIIEGLSIAYKASESRKRRDGGSLARKPMLAHAVRSRERHRRERENGAGESDPAAFPRAEMWKQTPRHVHAAKEIGFQLVLPFLVAEEGKSARADVQWRSDGPRQLFKASRLDVASIVDQAIDVPVDANRFRDLCVELVLRRADVELEYGGSGVLEVSQLRLGVPARGDDLVASGNERVDELGSEP